MYCPLDCAIGSHVSKAILFYSGTFVDHTTYSIMSKLSDKRILFVGRFLGIQVDEWILGGHGFGANVAFD